MYYINIVSDIYIAMVFRQTAGRNLDSGSLVMLMKELEKTQHVREVEVGRWLRIQHEIHHGTGHGLSDINRVLVT